MGGFLLPAGPNKLAPGSCAPMPRPYPERSVARAVDVGGD